MNRIPFGFREWIGEVAPNFRIDLIAGLTLWAMIVPEAVAYANLAGAPSGASGLYGIIIVLPIYAIFASSRYLVATSTSAISVTMASFMAVLSSQDAPTFAALVIGAAIAYLIFYFFKLGFVADFISEPVSRGFMFGLAAFIIVGQLPKVFGVEKTDGNTIEQALGLIAHIPSSNWPNFALAVLIFAVMIIAERISKRIPGGLLAMILVVSICYFLPAEQNWGLDMVGALPSGLPQFVVPNVSLSDLAVIVPAAIGLVILGSSEATVLAESLAAKHNQDISIDQQFFAFGIANLFGGFFGALLGTGSTSSTLVDHEAGAKTLMSTLWAALATLLTVLFLTGVFAYLPEVFLGVLIIHAVYHLLKLRQIIDVRAYSTGEFFLAVTALLAVLLFDVLSGLLIAMLLNVLYTLYQTAKVHVEPFGYAGDATHALMPISLGHDVKTPPENFLVLGLTQGQVFYASARRVFEQTAALLEAHPKADVIIVSLERMNAMDFSSYEYFAQFVKILTQKNKTLYVTNIRSRSILDRLQKSKFALDSCHISTHLDLNALIESYQNEKT